MKRVLVQTKSTRHDPSSSLHRSRVGGAGVALVPPKYGIDLVDQAQTKMKATASEQEIVWREAFDSPATLPVLIQAKLTVSQPGDPYEQEAEWVADRVLLASSGPASVGGPARIRRSVEQATRQTNAIPQQDDQQHLQTKLVGVNDFGEMMPPPFVHKVIPSSGQPLDPTTREFMEPRFGHDFSLVRVHTDARAAELARSLRAEAYTVGRDIVFGLGRYQPTSVQGRHLLGHELAHVVQQGIGRTVTPAEVKAAAYNEETALEMKVDADGDSAAHGRASAGISRLPVRSAGPAQVLRRETKDEVAREPREVPKEDSTKSPVDDINHTLEEKGYDKAPVNKKVYDTLCKKFGTHEKIKKYYKKMGRDTFLSKNVLVHEVLLGKLKSAEALLKNEKPQVETLNTLDVRPNANDPSVLSLHSYGCAIDIDPKTNPNVGKFPEEMVKSLTGVSMFGKDAQAFTLKASKDSAKTLEPKAATLSRASDSLKGIFKKEPKKWEEALPTCLQYLETQGFSFDQVNFNPSSVKNAAKEKKSSPLDSILGAVYKIDDKKDNKEKAIGEARNYLIGAYNIAESGFINLAPKLIAALTGSDGGGLIWGGGGWKGTGSGRDFMHFELRDSDYPQELKKK